jgi:hypothetical protein
MIHLLILIALIGIAIEALPLIIMTALSFATVVFGILISPLLIAKAAATKLVGVFKSPR